MRSTRKNPNMFSWIRTLFRSPVLNKLPQATPIHLALLVENFSRYKFTLPFCADIPSLVLAIKHERGAFQKRKEDIATGKREDEREVNQ